MKKVYWKGIFFVFLSIVSFSFFSCVEDGVTYDATDWEGRWKITEEIVFPKSTKAAYVGNIKKFTAMPGANDEHYAVQVTSVIREGE